MKKVIRILIVLLVVLAMVVAVGKRKKALKQTPPYGIRPLAVHVAAVIREPLEQANHYLGVVEPWQVARISSRVSARVETVACREGDWVKKGDLLLQLDDKDIRAQIKATESLIDGLKANKKFWVAENQRDEKLEKEGVISPVAAATTHNRMTEAVSKLETAEQNLDSLRTSLLYTQMTSPFDGQVTVRDVDPGDLAAPGKPLMVVEDRSALKIAFDAPQEDLAFLKVGLPVYSEVADQKAEWKISKIYPSLNRARMVRVEVKTPPLADLQSGSFLSLNVVWEKHEEAVTIPRESLMQRDSGEWFVFVVADKTLHLRSVKKVMESAGRVEIFGLEPGEKVVTSTFLGWANLSDGLKVEVAK